MTEEELSKDFEEVFGDLQSLTLTQEEMLEYISNLQSSVLINVESIGINISSISPVIKVDLGDKKITTITEQGKKITTESVAGDMLVTHTIDNDRDYVITSGSEIDGLFETS